MTRDELIQIKFYRNTVCARETSDDDLPLFFNSINGCKITFGDEVDFIVNVGILAYPAFEGGPHDLAYQLYCNPSLTPATGRTQ